MTDQGRWIPGVAQPLPAGEALLWRGAPARAALARHAFHTRALAGYFAVIILLGLLGAVRDGVAVPQLLTTLLTQAALAGVALGIVHGYAAMVARSTVYAITERRVVLKVGLVVPTTINLPLRLIESASSKVYPDGTGEIVLGIRPPDRLGYIHLWPHVRAWRLRWPEPLLRGLTDTRAAAEALRQAAQASDLPPVEPAPAPASAGTPALAVAP